MFVRVRGICLPCLDEKTANSPLFKDLEEPLHEFSRIKKIKLNESISEPNVKGECIIPTINHTSHLRLRLAYFNIP